MNCCGLSSTGLQNIDANELTSDNSTVFSNLNVSGFTTLSNDTSIFGTLNVNNFTILANNTTINGALYLSGVNVLSSIDNINKCIGPSNSALNITGTTNITFNAGGLASSYIDSSGLNLYHTGMTTFPFSYDGYYNVRERFDNLRHVFLDSPDPVIKYDDDHNTIIKINEANILDPGNPLKNYPKRIIFKDFLNNVPAFINTSGLNLLDINGNYNNINNKFTQTGNSLLICGTNTMIDSNNNLNVLKVNTQTVAGITITTGSWLNVADNLSNVNKSITDTLTPIASVFSAIGSIGEYFEGLLGVWAVINGFINSTGLLLAFALKMDRFTPTIPLIIVPPGPSEGFNKLELDYNNTLTIDSSNKLSINTAGFLTSPASDLALIANATGQTTVVLKTISQPMTCQSELNVSGLTTLSNNTTLVSSLNVSGLTTLSNNTTLVSSLNVSGLTTLSNNTTLASSLNVSGTTTLSNDVYIKGNLNIDGTTTIIDTIHTNTTFSSLNISGISTFYNLVTLNSSLNVSGLTTLSNNTTLTSSLNVSGLTTLSNNTIINGSLNVVGSMFSNNINTQKAFNINITTPSQIGSTVYYRYDLDLTKYTTFISIGTTTQTRKFKFMCWLSSGAHNSGLYSLNYDIDYSFCQNLSNFNGLNALAYGFPYNNYNLNQITPNGLFIWKYTFDYITIFSKNQINLQCIIIDYLN